MKFAECENLCGECAGTIRGMKHGAQMIRAMDDPPQCRGLTRNVAPHHARIWMGFCRFDRHWRQWLVGCPLELATILLAMVHPDAAQTPTPGGRATSLRILSIPPLREGESFCGFPMATSLSNACGHCRNGSISSWNRGGALPQSDRRKDPLRRLDAADLSCRLLRQRTGPIPVELAGTRSLDFRS